MPHLVPFQKVRTWRGGGISPKMVRCEVSSLGEAPAPRYNHEIITCSRMEKKAQRSRLELERIRFLHLIETRETSGVSMESQNVNSVKYGGPIGPDRFTDPTPSCIIGLHRGPNRPLLCPCRLLDPRKSLGKHPSEPG